MTFDARLAATLAPINLSDRGEPVALNKWFANELGLAERPGQKRWRPVRFTYVSDKANVRPRLNQFLATTPTVAAAVLGAHAEDQTREDLVDFATAKVVGPGRPAEAFIIVTEDQPTVLDIVGDPASPLVSQMMSLCPGALLHPIAGAVTSSPARGPVVNLPVVPLVVDPRLERMLRLAIATTPAVMLVGPPGTGKSTLVDHVLTQVAADAGHFDIRRPPSGVRRITAEEGWTFQDLVGGQTVVDGELVFRPGHLLQALAADEWLVLDEANRADLDKIFGGLLTWLADQEVQLASSTTASDAPIVELGWDKDAERSSGPTDAQLQSGDPSNGPLRYVANADWRLIGTYNAVDAQRVFRLGQALGRRFMRVPVPPITVAQFRQVLASWTSDLPDRVSQSLAGVYAAHLDTESPLGPAIFMRAASYVVNGLRLEFGYSSDNDGDPPSDDSIDSLLVEAYVLSVGTMLAQLPPEEVEQLGVRLRADAIFDEDQWSFVTDLLPSLG